VGRGEFRPVVSVFGEETEEKAAESYENVSIKCKNGSYH
jgi:hypothetical protein